MEDERKNDNDLADLAGMLQDLAPTRARLDTAQTLFLAGQQSIRRHQRWQILWPLSSACLAVTCITLGVLLARPTQSRIVYVPVERSTEMATDKDEANLTKPLADRDHHPKARRTQIATNYRTDTTWLGDLKLRRWQTRLLDGSLDHVGPEPTTEEPVIITPIRSSDWRNLLTDAHLSERFPQTTTPSLFDWTALFSTRGS